FIEEHFPTLKPLFGIDLAAFQEIGRLLSGDTLSGDAVLLRVKAVPAPGQVVGPPRLEVNDRPRQNMIINRSYPQIPLGLITHFPAFCFSSQGGGARGLEVRLGGTALQEGMIDIVSAKLIQRRPRTDRKRRNEYEAAAQVTPTGALLRFDDVEVP